MASQLLSERLTEKPTSIFRSATGVIRWLADQSRPDCAHPCLVMNTKQLAPTWKEVKLFNATVDKIIRQPIALLYKKLEPSKWFVTVFCDASHASLNNGDDSCGGYLIFLSNGYKQGERKTANILAWKSTKIKRVCRSSTAAETIVLANAMEEGDLIREQIITMTGLSKARLELVAGVEQMADSLTKLGASEVDLVETLNKGKFFN